MEIEQALRILSRHNRWRRGADIEQADPKQLGIAIDLLIEYVRASEHVEEVRAYINLN